MLTRSLLALVSLVALSTVACAATTDAAPSGEDDGATDEAAVTAQAACGKAAYDKAFARYKAAVEHAKARANGGDVCGDGMMLSDIANDLGSAVATCGKFKTVIATSQRAAPVRKALAGNLALAAVDGRLDGKTMTGLGEALPGTTLFGPAPGAYGNVRKIAFAAGGKATASVLDIGDGSAAPTWKDSPARWSIKGTQGGAATVTITVDGKATDYTLKADPVGAPYQNLPEFLLKPAGEGDEYRAMPSECEA